MQSEFAHGRGDLRSEVTHALFVRRVRQRDEAGALRARYNVTRATKAATKAGPEDRECRQNRWPRASGESANR